MANLYNHLPAMIHSGESASEVDLAFDGLIHDDLASFDDETPAEHFTLHGRAEGHHTSPATYWRGLVTLVPDDVGALEGGPVTKPVLHEPRVRYFDVMDRAGLLERAAHHAHVTNDSTDIDFATPNIDLSIVPESRVDAIIQAHKEQCRVHTGASVREHRAFTTHHDTAWHWAGDSADPNAHSLRDRERDARLQSDDVQGDYIDFMLGNSPPRRFTT